MGLSWGYYIGIIASVLTIIASFLGIGRFFFRRYKRKKKYYKQKNKKTTKIKLENCQAYRPVYEYFKRDIDADISTQIIKKKSILLVGKPLSGKSRILYESLQAILGKISVSILKIRDYRFDDFIYPRNFRKKKKTHAVIIEDLHSFVKQYDFNFILSEFKKRGFIIISSCRSGYEYTNTKDVFIKKMGTFEGFYDNNIFKVDNIDSAKAEEIANLNNLSWDEIRKRFDGTIGSLFMPLEEMNRRFNECSKEEKLILRDLKKLYHLEIYIEKDIYLKSWIITKSNEKVLELKIYEFEHILEKLKAKEFLEFDRNNIFIDSAYIIGSIKFTSEPLLLDVVNEMIDVYEETPKVLYKIGNKIRMIWYSSNKENTDLLILSKEQYEKAILQFSREKEEIDLAMTYSNLAGTLSDIGVIDANISLIDEASKIYDSTLEIFTQEKYPQNFSITIFNRANHLISKSTVIKEKKILEDALDLLNSIVENIPKIKMQILYIHTLQQIGQINLCLVEYEPEHSKKVKLCLISKKYFDDAIQIFKETEYPFFHFTLLIFFANLHRILANYDNKEENCVESLRYYNRALDFSTEEPYLSFNSRILSSREKLSQICNS